MQQRDLEQFKNFARRVAERATIRTPQNDQSYTKRFGKSRGAVSRDSYTKEDILSIMESGDAEQMRALSRYLSRFSGIYSRVSQYYASLLTYQYILVPHYDISNPPKKLSNSFMKTARYVKQMHLSSTLSRISNIIFEEGVFFGLLQSMDKDQPVIYNLPSKYCRTRFNDENGLPILELNLSYFTQVIKTNEDREIVFKLFPNYIREKFMANNGASLTWVEIPPKDGGMVFFFTEDMTPPFIASSAALADLDDARDRENKRDENELYKILIQKLPIDKSNGELLFTLEEATELHNSVGEMLQDIPTIDVLTTYADVKLESVQDADEAASAANSRLSKYVNSAYDEFGVTRAMFNVESGSTAITFSIKKDIALMYAWSKQYETWINMHLKECAKSNSLYFSITLLPDSYLFREEDISNALKGAQYGYPKTAVSAAMGIEVADMMQMCDFENNIMNLKEIMLPLSSSYTESSSTEKNSKIEKKSSEITNPDYLNNEGGRPEKSLTERSDKTVQNRESAT